MLLQYLILEFFAIIIECVVEGLAKEITKNISIPTIGIGASKHCDGQILVTEDMVGLSGFSPKFVKHYANLNKSIEKSIKRLCWRCKKWKDFLLLKTYTNER